MLDIDNLKTVTEIDEDALAKVRGGFEPLLKSTGDTLLKAQSDGKIRYTAPWYTEYVSTFYFH